MGLDLTRLMKGQILVARKTAARAALLAFLALLGLLLLAGCRPTGDATEPAAAAGVVATSKPAARPTAATVATGLQLVVLPDVGEDAFLQAIASAQRTIRLKIYLITLDEVVDALKEAARRGVVVQVMIEPEPEGGGDSNRLAFEELRSAGIDVRNTPGAFRLSHEKSLVVDDQRAYIMTHNLTYSSFNKNREYRVEVDDLALVTEVAQVFDDDWSRRQPDLSRSLLVWSPDNSRERLTGLIDSAQTSLDLEQNSLLDEDLIDQLIAAAHRGVAVRVITPDIDNPADREMVQVDRLLAGGAQVAFLDTPYVHAKTILADGKAAFVGSQNFSVSSIDSNRELGIIFDDAAAINRLASTFVKDWGIADHLQGEPDEPAPAPPAGVVPWQEADQYVGQVITVEGDIVDTHDTGSVTFLNFSRDLDDFTLVVFQEDNESFPIAPETMFNGQRVRATGEVELYRNRPEIIIRSPDQIEIIGPTGAVEPATRTDTIALDISGGSADAEAVSWEEAGQFIGQTITVEGDVVRTYNSGKVAFLNFSRDYQGTFTVAIFASDFNQWPQPPDQFFDGQRIRVTGAVKEYQGAPEMVVESPAQIEVLGLAQQETAAEPATAVAWQDAAGYDGQQITVQGRVVDTYRSDKVIFLNFSPDRDEFKVVIFRDDWDKWPQPPNELFHGHNVRITGEVELYQGAPEIIVEQPDQIELLAE